MASTKDIEKIYERLNILERSEKKLEMRVQELEKELKDLKDGRKLLKDEELPPFIIQNDHKHIKKCDSGFLEKIKGRLQPQMSSEVMIKAIKHTISFGKVCNMYFHEGYIYRFVEGGWVKEDSSFLMNVVGNKCDYEKVIRGLSYEEEVKEIVLFERVDIADDCSEEEICEEV